jgi:hypothetical protein
MRDGRLARLLRRLQVGFQVAPPTVEANTDDRIAPEIVAGQYAVLAETIGNIFNEFWQGNAFFLTFSSVVLGSILVNWTKFSTAPTFAVLAVGVAYIFLLGIWLMTMVRHAFYIGIHMDHAMRLERETPGLEVYTHRIQEAAKSQMPSIRKVWLSVPVLFALCMVGVEISALTHVDQPQRSSTPAPRSDPATPPRKTTPNAAPPRPAARKTTPNAAPPRPAARKTTPNAAPPRPAARASKEQAQPTKAAGR